MNRSLTLGRRCDSDFDWPWDLDTTARFFATPQEVIGNLFGWHMSFIAQAAPPGIVLGDGRLPRFMLCRECMAEAGVAYYRVEFRFAFMRLCQRHHIPLIIPNTGRLLESIQGEDWNDLRHWGVRLPTPPDEQRLRERLALETRICRLLKLGYERHPVLGVVPAQAILAQNRVRLLGPQELWPVEEKRPRKAKVDAVRRASMRSRKSAAEHDHGR